MHNSRLLFQMRYRVPIRLPGLPDAAGPYGGFLDAWAFAPLDCLQWYDEFRQRALDAIGKHYLPVCRLADGEFQFLVGRHVGRQGSGSLVKQVALATLLRLGLYLERNEWGQRRLGIGMKTSWGEHYWPMESRRLRARYISDLRTLSAEGILAPFFIDSGDAICSHLIPPTVKSFESHHICLSPSNYVPFHFPLYLLTGPGNQDFLKDRNLLVVTSLNDEKKINLEASFASLGSRSVRFYPISAHRAMFDVVRWEAVPNDIDLCLVAAGIGAANIVLQLRPLNTLVLDIGGLMDCLIDPSRVYHGFIHSPACQRQEERAMTGRQK